ncbi:uncharacterized protein LOC143919998 [Arctopsyche grandis]|uniref:uncharacterized protein LOC143919998 n=1 Tax=Arctopsyche grandis TaxID=121162 RepID=UPI00406D883B
MSAFKVTKRQNRSIITVWISSRKSLLKDLIREGDSGAKDIKKKPISSNAEWSNSAQNINLIENMSSTMHRGNVTPCDYKAEGLNDDESPKIISQDMCSQVSFKCDICLKSFTHRRKLVKHSKSHCEGKPFKCDICLKLLIFKLIDHVEIHNEVKRHKCDICFKLLSLKKIS